VVNHPYDVQGHRSISLRFDWNAWRSVNLKHVVDLKETDEVPYVHLRLFHLLSAHILLQKNLQHIPAVCDVSA
jgi:hypothetical protein